MKHEPVKVERLLNGREWRLCLDQFGNRIWARTVKELRENRGGGRVSKIYRDSKSGKTQHCGYAIGNQWFQVFAPITVEA